MNRMMVKLYAGNCRLFSRQCWLLALLLTVASCHSGKPPDLSGVEVDLKLNRMEKDLFALSASAYPSQIDSLRKKYPVLFPFYFREIGGWDLEADTTKSWKDSIWQYVQSPYSQALYDSTMMRFDDVTVFAQNLQLALRYFKYYFPKAAIPEVNTLINAPPAFTVGNDLLCISLDKYLGPGSAFYKYETEPVPQYLLRRFTPEYMVCNCIHVLATANFEFNAPGKKLLDAMIYNGKILYLKKKVLPAADDSIITGYTKADLVWCKNNEPEIWKFFIEKKLLYSTDPLQYAKYINEGPSTSGMPEEAPGNIGSWVGWRIVTAFMEKNEGYTLQQLMEETDAQKILSASKYKPLR
ncbi:MAG: hypothetical protein K1X61_08165 [Chitinophagales bacterium]|nr:hypothetical protein [Chitinophagales bacterium]